jgi:hypothetical protein
MVVYLDGNITNEVGNIQDVTAASASKALANLVAVDSNSLVLETV